MLDRAILLAVNCHLGQYRKHAIHGQLLPYIAHPLEVMQTVWGWGVVEPVVMTAAVLHDILEDSDTTARLLAKEFGEEVTQIVQELTHVPQNGNKQQYIQTFSTASVPALVVKLADRYCNLRHRLVAAPDKVEAYHAKSTPLVAALQARRAEIAGRFGETTAKTIVSAYQELARKVAEGSVVPQTNPKEV